MKVRQVLAALKRDDNAATAIEFGILGPMLFVMMLGVLQVGTGMQAYNAMRSAAADTARYAVIERQKGNTRTDTELRAQAQTIATSLPYSLHTADLTATVAAVATSRVAGATEKTLTYTYTVSSVLAFIDIPGVSLTYSRPIFTV